MPSDCSQRRFLYRLLLRALHVRPIVRVVKERLSVSDTAHGDTHICLLQGPTDSVVLRLWTP